MIKALSPCVLMPPQVPFNCLGLMITTKIFGYIPDSSSPGTTGSIPIDIFHRGVGRAHKCEVSGEWFPSSRIRRDGRGRMVGDIYWTGRNPQEDND